MIIDNYNERDTLRFGTWNVGGLNRKLASVTKCIVELDLNWVFITETQWEERNRDPPNWISNVRGLQGRWGRANYGTMLLHNPYRKPFIEILYTGEHGWCQIWRIRGVIFIGLYIKPGNIYEEEVDHLHRVVGIYDRFIIDSNPAIILGDLNAHIGFLSGDDDFNPRGEIWLSYGFIGLESDKTINIVPAETLSGKRYTFRRISTTGQCAYLLVDHNITSNINMLDIQVDYHEHLDDHA